MEAGWSGLRQARFRGETQILRVMVGGAVCLFGIVSLWAAAHNLDEVVALRRFGRAYEAQVINKEPEAQLGHATSGLVYYSFRVAHTPVTGSFRAARADYPLLRTGRHLAITYLPADPRIHRLGGVDNGRLALEGAATLLLLLCGALYLVGPPLAFEILLRQELRLARCGIAIDGAITGSKPLYKRSRRVGHCVRYEFVLPEGRALQGSARIGPVDGEPTLIGFPITILYAPARPEQHRPLAAFHHVRFSRMPKSVL